MRGQAASVAGPAKDGRARTIAAAECRFVARCRAPLAAAACDLHPAFMRRAERLRSAMRRAARRSTNDDRARRQQLPHRPCFVGKHGQPERCWPRRVTIVSTAPPNAAQPTNPRILNADSHRPRADATARSNGSHEFHPLRSFLSKGEAALAFQ